MKVFNKTKTVMAAVLVLLLVSTSVFLSNCKKTDHNPDKKRVDLKLIADGLTSPLGVVAIPDGSKRLAVIDQAGKIWLIDANGNKMATPFMDITSKLVTLSPEYDERGLLGLAFHPDYKNNGRFYVYYTAPPRAGAPEGGTAWDNLSVISEFKVSASDPNMADMNSERPLFQIDDPQSNHNGGTLAFGPNDGYLYISIGDGGAADDVAPGHVDDWYAENAGGNGQDIEHNLFGNVLRIDVNNGNPYAIPADNPFVNSAGLDEIYAYGFRNPYRFSFDMGGSHKLYVGDAGQLLYEEVDDVEKGGNYGWNVKEGFHCFNTDSSLLERPSCPDVDNFGKPLIDPVIEINNWQNPEGGRATTVIGGNVYRGHAIPEYQGRYIFGTFSQNFERPNAELFSARPAGPGPWNYEEVPLVSYPNDLGHYLKGFGQDLDGEIYLTMSSNLGPSGNTGQIYKLVPVK